MKKLLFGIVKRAFTGAGGGLATITNEKNEWDAEAKGALLVRVLTAVAAMAVAYVGAKHGFDVSVIIAYLLG